MRNVAAKASDETIEHIDVLAVRFSGQLGREVSRSEVVRPLLDVGLDRYPVTDEERARFRAGVLPALPKSQPARPQLRLLNGRAEDELTSPRGGALSQSSGCQVPLHAA